MSLVNILGKKQYLNVVIFESKFQLSKILLTTLFNKKKNIILTEKNYKNIDKKDVNSLIEKQKESSKKDENIDKNDINYSDFFWEKQKEPNYYDNIFRKKK